MNEISKTKLKEIREKMNLKKKDLAKIMGMNVSNYSRIESTKTKRIIKLTKIQKKFIEIILYVNKHNSIKEYLKQMK